MAAATADRDAQRSDGAMKAFLVAASTTIYKDTLVGLNASGYLVAMSGVAGLVFVGVAYENSNNSAGSNGGTTCRVRNSGEYLFNYAAANGAQAQIGTTQFCVDNQTVDESLTAYDAILYPIGICVEVPTASTVRVKIGVPGAPQFPNERPSILGMPVFTIGTQTAHVVNAAVQLTDVEGQPLTHAVLVTCWLSSDTAGKTLAGPATSVLIGTNGVILKAETALELFQILSNASGQFDLNLTDTSSHTFYLSVAGADGWQQISGAIGT